MAEAQARGEVKGEETGRLPVKLPMQLSPNLIFLRQIQFLCFDNVIKSGLKYHLKLFDTKIQNCFLLKNNFVR